MILEEYKTLEEKEEFFDYEESVRYTDLNSVFNKIEQLNNKEEEFIYRGCSEAKYKLYNSAQRLYFNQELYFQSAQNTGIDHYIKFIEELIESSKKWNGGVIQKLLKNAGIDSNLDLAYLSYMQHMGVPTPLLDFTYNPYVALFFAIDNLEYTASNTEIDNYFSFYYARKNSDFTEACTDHISDLMQSDGTMYNAIGGSSMGLIYSDIELYKIVNSVNIINQEGLFYFNCSRGLPIEKTYTIVISEIEKELGQEEYKKKDIDVKFAGCLNIHKSLIPAIKDKLKEKGISSSTIYPDMNDFRQRVTEEGIFKSLNTDSNQLKIVYKE